MPIPNPNKGERETRFIPSCMADPAMVKDYPDTKQREAICYQSLKDRNKK